MLDYMEVAREAALEAGMFLNQQFNALKQVEKKFDGSLVTEFDKKSEQLIIQKIAGSFPKHSILAEESGRQGKDEFLWVVDPLDGTHNFIRGITMYGVCIGLVYRDEFVGGVVYMPSYDEMYMAEKGSGAFKNGKSVVVSRISSLPEATLLYDSGIAVDGEIKVHLLFELSRRFFNVRMLGASCRNLTWLAEGKADVLMEFGEKPWDFVAGAVILVEAGGVIRGLHGEDIDINSKSYIASNGLLDLEMRKIAGKALERKR